MSAADTTDSDPRWVEVERLFALADEQAAEARAHRLRGPANARQRRILRDAARRNTVAACDLRDQIEADGSRDG